MYNNKQHTCPVCEYEKNTTGQPIIEGDGMVCVDCGSSWRIIENEPCNKPIFNPDYELASTALVDHRVFNKRHYETHQMKSMPLSAKPNASDYSMFITSAVLLISLGLFLQTWFWLNPQKTEVTLLHVKLEEFPSRSGENVYKVHGVLSNETVDTKPIPKIVIALKDADGQTLVKWHHNTPILSLKSKSRKRFASSIALPASNVAYAEARLQK